MIRNLKEVQDNNFDITRDAEEVRKVIEERYDELVPKHVVTEDILASVNYLLNLEYNTYITDPAKRLHSLGANNTADKEKAATTIES